MQKEYSLLVTLVMKWMYKISYLHVEQIGLNEQNTVEHTHAYIQRKLINTKHRLFTGLKAN